MSTSLLYHGFGLRGYRYLRTEYISGHVYFSVEMNSADPKHPRYLTFHGLRRCTNQNHTTQNRRMMGQNIGHGNGFTVAGPCQLCRECSITDCKFSQIARPSIEGCGIDATARNNGVPINVSKTKDEKQN